MPRSLCIEPCQDIERLTTHSPEPVTPGEKVFVSWSGGKDSCFACFKAIQAGLDVRFLASMLTRNTGRLFPHYVTVEVLRVVVQGKCQG